MLTEKTRFKAWQLVRVRSRWLFADRSHGSAWQRAARIYRDRAINLAQTVAQLQQDIHTWEDAYAELEQRSAEAPVMLDLLRRIWEDPAMPAIGAELLRDLDQFILREST